MKVFSASSLLQLSLGWGSLVLTKRLEVKKNVVVHLRASDRFAF